MFDFFIADFYYCKSLTVSGTCGKQKGNPIFTLAH